MIKLSVVIIAFNEERNIGRCIDSVSEIADEVLVVDSGSTDATKAICETKGARVIEHAFEGHIEQKNYAALQATYEWVLSLDADEALSPELQNSIKEWLKGAENENHSNTPSPWERGRGVRPNGYTMNRLTNYCGHWVRYCGWYPDTKLRLFNRAFGAWGGTNPHDKYELHDKKAPTGFLKGDILHYSYYTVDEHYKQMTYFADIAAKASVAKGKKANSSNLIINPVAKFIRHFIVKLGFLDGKTGFTISRISAWGTYLKYYKMLEIQRSGVRSQ
ncbi:MAG: glycosyltransferase family 2 protein [Sphingobacteriales bacterium JAD_PAG50586_3]|nr:MAG: glycosyltransferase family 2 protein [Sphingobacteriales bacterium JAD_PAG50586_3]